MLPTQQNHDAKPGPVLPWTPRDIYSRPYRAAAILEMARIGDDQAIAYEAIRTMRILLPACRVSSSTVPLEHIRERISDLTPAMSRQFMHLLATAAGMQDPDFRTVCRDELGLDVRKIPIQDKIFCQLIAKAGPAAMTDAQRVAVAIIIHHTVMSFVAGVQGIFPDQYAAAMGSDGDDGGGSGEAAAAAALAPAPVDPPDYAPAFSVIEAAMAAADDDPSP
ncbi:hypothetical protein CHU95_20115 [Niveispirillum lacus]|uniref:Uncharacterized protein n=1 Tax=Niveispirillum lacus TaxID=1981099 RepID=A0A255YQH2_9PROT|nr:hypothetical protein [Niveispirillum lacus]OYQ31459.1 hypothetical protein CHU95_20115 [Niveispirillum lacus]